MDFRIIRLPALDQALRPHIWDLGGTMTATFADKSDPGEPVGFINSDQVLEITVTVTLTGKILNDLCNTSLCVCLAFEACQSGRRLFFDSRSLKEIRIHSAPELDRVGEHEVAKIPLLDQSLVG